MNHESVQNNSAYILDVTNLGIDFGGLQALDDFNIQVKDREIVGLIGPNGAGKTTIFNLLTSVYQPSRGNIQVTGRSTKGKTPHEVSQFGIARTFQNIRLFKNISVIDNVKIALHNGMKYSMLSAILRLPSYWREEKAATKLALELLAVFNMQDLADQPAGSLPYGAQRRLEIVRALATNPKVLLLDEPAAGMNPSETAELMSTIRDIRDQFNMAIVLIEHDMSLVMGICERILVLNYGLIIAQGTPEEIKNSPVVIEAYLGQQRGE
ncbi:MAG: ABC transporter ATP-binding protein [Oscillospiraceae bacterium]|jgi:branched-chain amino acid transport system ATP-binding protein|nr:ABC transporter ATP-binding protein [Oscillospiraceae bacterium]